MVGWGSLAQDLQNRVQVGQRLMVEGRLRMNTVTRQDGVKEKRAELTLARLHPLTGGGAGQPATAGAVMGARSQAPAPTPGRAAAAARSTAPSPARSAAPPAPEPATWNASPLVPDLPDGDDEIPF